ncbi:ENT1_2_3 [Mytilus edulis]|uniref:SLC29A1_2_3 n=1 Tax=Mytilus edulis TaxID=6550 RepID=A0A8S3THK0_MYTED|nr:ENT1_2_3 [Mytilus edulis]
MTTVTGNDYYPKEPKGTKNQYNINGNGKMGDDDKDAFLPPVKLEPGLDSLNRNPEEFDELDPSEENAPPDRYRIVFFIMLVHGIGILMPWNMLINAQAYFENYKLAENTTEVNNLRSNFMFSIGIASQVPNFIMSGVNAFVQCGGQASPRRIAISIVIMTMIFIGTVVLAMLDSSTWSVEFFYITMIMAAVLNMATGVYQNSTFGLAAILPMKYTNAIVLGNIWVQAVSVWFVFFVTLAIFPGVWANIKRIDFPLEDQYWAPIFCFLSFNLFAFLGNLTSEFIRVPGHRWVWIPVAIRGLLIPFFLMCNFKPEERIFDVLIENDYIYIVGGVVLGFTSGYFSSLCMMYGPKLVDQQYAGTAGMIMAFFLVLGIGTGVNFSLVLGLLTTRPVA